MAAKTKNALLFLLFFLLSCAIAYFAVGGFTVGEGVDGLYLPLLYLPYAAAGGLCALAVYLLDGADRCKALCFPMLFSLPGLILLWKFGFPTLTAPDAGEKELLGWRSLLYQPELLFDAQEPNLPFAPAFGILSRFACGFAVVMAVLSLVRMLFSKAERPRFRWWSLCYLLLPLVIGCIDRLIYRVYCMGQIATVTMGATFFQKVAISASVLPLFFLGAAMLGALCTKARPLPVWCPITIGVCSLAVLLFAAYAPLLSASTFAQAPALRTLWSSKGFQQFTYGSFFFPLLSGFFFGTSLRVKNRSK